ncbi:hypothetical protein GCM10011577_39710 [Pseudarthrobacter polychromogenes]|uniref:Uncharacterized protein n=1 Tax=Pseudarthrobacter polychromogenes TaxID=1676 RepID=A0ABQ1Y404_9MICC|nr:hypothetical protein GCM10011577_39710 [Pseudarthrobacter polychromogenes]
MTPRMAEKESSTASSGKIWFGATAESLSRRDRPKFLTLMPNKRPPGSSFTLMPDRKPSVSYSCLRRLPSSSSTHNRCRVQCSKARWAIEPISVANDTGDLGADVETAATPEAKQNINR